MKQDGGAAFPTPPIILDDDSVGVIPDEHYHGMTMRQAYKMAALSGEAAHRECTGEPKMMAEWAGRMADAMLAEDAAHEGGEDER